MLTSYPENYPIIPWKIAAFRCGILHLKTARGLPIKVDNLCNLLMLNTLHWRQTNAIETDTGIRARSTFNLSPNPFLIRGGQYSAEQRKTCRCFSGCLTAREKLASLLIRIQLMDSARIVSATFPLSALPGSNIKFRRDS
jgi:hypothetical protein